MSDKNSVVLDRFKALVDNSGKTRQEIAQIIGCDTSTVTKQYNGDMKISVDYLVKYAKLFEVSTDYLLGLTIFPSIKEVKYYSGKIICIEKTVSFPGMCITPSFTIGKIYEVLDGEVIDDNGVNFYPFKTLREINKVMNAKFIKLVE